jgi:hypothetical protein
MYRYIYIHEYLYTICGKRNSNYIYMYIYCIYVLSDVSNRKWKPRQFSLISFVFCSSVDEETNRSYPVRMEWKGIADENIWFVRKYCRLCKIIFKLNCTRALENWSRVRRLYFLLFAHLS